MRGEFMGVKSELIKGIFEKLVEEMSDEGFSDEEFWSDLLREAIPQPKAPKTPDYTDYDEDGKIYLDGDLELYEEHKLALETHKACLEAYTDAATRSDLAWQYIITYFEDPTTTERQIVKSLGAAFEAIEDFGGGNLANSFYQLVEEFLEKYSLRYDLRRPFQLNPTLPGLFARLINDLKSVASSDPALQVLLQDYEEAFHDLGFGATEGRMKTCFSKQFNLLEALAAQHPNATQDTLGKICAELDVWPHATVREAARKVYGFRSYPGVGHGAGGGALRPIEMKDLVAVSVMLTAFVPYVSDKFNADVIYQAGEA